LIFNIKCTLYLLGVRYYYITLNFVGLVLFYNVHIMSIAVTRKAHFNAAHRLFNPKWDEVKNNEVFGLCSLPNYHGHNYELEVTVIGDIDPETGFVIDLKYLKEIIYENVEKRFDHKNLNLDTAEFRNLNPTAENIAIVIWNLIKPKLSEAQQLQVTLYETERNFVTYKG